MCKTCTQMQDFYSLLFLVCYGFCMTKKTYSGFVAIIGPTNAGKSTLLNQIMGRKVSIVSHKVQTTRTRLRAVKMVGDKQLVFVDTPGVFKPSRRLDRAMVAAAMDAVSDADAVLLLVDAQKGLTETIRMLVEKIKDCPNIFVALFRFQHRQLRSGSNQRFHAEHLPGLQPQQAGQSAGCPTAS